nr:hypothetical protein [Acidobacteriota bacterium]
MSTTPLLAFLFGRSGGAAEARDEPPIREELFSVERLEQYAASLASEHVVSAGPRRGRRLLPRLEENGRQLVAAYRALAEAIREEHSISPAAEWLVDNFHIVEEQLREIREDLPVGFYRELPKLVRGELEGYPRIYAVSLALIAHTDSRLETETLRRFITAYQATAPLTMGELWAVAITLRLALVENLSRLATRIVAAREEREEADALADRLLEIAGRQPEALVPQLAGRVGRREDLDRAFVVQLTQRLREQDPSLAPVFDWLERHLGKRGQTTEQIVHLEHQRQAAAQVTVGNIITSMRLLSTLDWRDFFESVSLVDPVLAEDPAGVYALMSFQTRDRYRHVVERVSKRTKTTEIEVARRAVELAAGGGDSEAGRDHVGFYLIDEGSEELERSFAYRPRPRERVLRFVLKHPTPFYLGTLALTTALVVVLLAFAAYASGAGVGMLVALVLLSLVPASDLAVSVLNWDVTHLLAPRLLPSMESEDGVPADALTMVVVPTLLTSPEGVRELVEKLEVHYLANQDENLYFALLGDFGDAGAEEVEEDEALLELAFDGVEELNARHHGSSSGGDNDGGPKRFHLFTRRRLWNEGEGKWLGWERKRGKLEEFNRLLRGARDTTFAVSTAPASLLSKVRYVITLDSDTQLPRDAARSLVAVAYHPLNRPHYDPRAGRVVRGYGIIQPRVSVSLESAARSSFARVFSGNTGIDPYTTAASDIYQDLFGEGSFTGKGLYDVDAFSRSLEGRVPENSLLSHDLFESLYARAALVTDIELLDDYPAHYDTYAKRQHRWTRGDWQIARWMMPRVPDAQGRSVRNPLPLAARWKIFDNLRRSLFAPVTLVWLVAAWTVWPGSVALWTLFVVLMLAFPVYAHVTTSLLLHPRGIPWTSHFWSVWGDVLTNTAQVALSVAFLAHQAGLMADAVARTVWRKLFSRRRLLEWTTAAQAEQGSAKTAAAYFRFMWAAPALALAACAAVLLLRPSALAVAAPLVLAWLLSPLVAHLVSRRLTSAREPLSAGEAQALRLIARRTWRYFESFVGEEDNWLPPDNFQEDPRPVIAHRTSPTNAGLLLLSTVAAHDFGYMGTLELVERLSLTFKTLERLPRFRGHFFNWYDTRTLEALAPQYVSTVDSGNFVGHLLAVKQACVELPDGELFGARTLEGLADAVALAREEASRLGAALARTGGVGVKQLREELERLAQLVEGMPPRTLSGWSVVFGALTRHASLIEDIVGALSHEQGEEAFAELRVWLGTLRRQTQTLARDLGDLTRESFMLAAQLPPLISFCPADRIARWEETARELDATYAPARLAALYEEAQAQLSDLGVEVEQSTQADAQTRSAARGALALVRRSIEDAAASVAALLTRAAGLAGACQRVFDETDFKFLLDPERKVFRIGYNVTDARADNSFYDLFASESRLASFAAIAKGDVPQEHWFRLGRKLTPVDGGRALISWTGTMFEYLMPLLVMRDYERTLLHETYGAVVGRQIEYGEERGVPWGISESAYNARDLQLNYQYAPFGVPGLGLK